MRYQAVIFDFDGVLCHDRFYANLQDSHPQVYDFVQTRVFGEASDIADRWMRGELSSDDVNRIVSDSTSVDFAFLSWMLVESVRQMRPDRRLLDLALSLRARRIGVALVTGNMDVFTRVTVPHNRLDDIFPVIVNSWDYHQNKCENGGRLFDIAVERLGNGATIQRSLLIDNSRSAVQTFTAKGGEAYLYTTYDEFLPWARRSGLVAGRQE